MKQVGIAFDVNCQVNGLTAQGINFSLSSFLEKLTS